ncbi:MAG: hypothetical protein HN509_06365, partial [Halobacteriovoraceae bacterium]|nr:hypothetical protein [Halobacteriovoraceae bacterium]
YSIERHYPSAKTFENPYLQFLKCVAEAQSSLVAQWMAVGFIHGVMNTDNMAISGETLDFGPCAFMDNFAFDRVYSSIDRHGRYSYNNQIPIAIWNLYRLAECLIPLLDSEPQKGQAVAQNFLEEIKEIYQQNWLDKMRPKLGLQSTEPEDESLINQWLQYLEIEDLDFTLSFRNLDPTSASSSESQLFKSFHQKWLVRLQQQSIPLDQIKNAMNNVNPLFIPRNHQVEKAIQGALVQDYSIFEELKQVLKNPYGDQDRFKQYQTPPLPNERIAATFCGT